MQMLRCIRYEKCGNTFWADTQRQKRGYCPSCKREVYEKSTNARQRKLQAVWMATRFRSQSNGLIYYRIDDDTWGDERYYGHAEPWTTAEVFKWLKPVPLDSNWRRENTNT